MPFICLSTLVLGSVSVAADSYLSAHGRPGIVALGSAALGIVWVVITAPLLPFMGTRAIGVGNLIGALVEVAILDIATRQSAGVAITRPLVRPTSVALIAGTTGWLVCTSGPHGLWISMAAGGTTLALCLIGLWLLCREDLIDTLGLTLETVRSVISREGRNAAGPESEGPDDVEPAVG
jgi:hypothetical protein